MVLDQSADVLASNACADILLRQHTAIGAEEDGPEGVRKRLKAVLRSAGSRFRLDAESWALVERPGRRPLALHAVPAGDDADPYARTVVILVDLEQQHRPSPDALQRLFALTPAEAQIALLIAGGESPTEIARAKHVSLPTIRSQLAAIFAKTQTRRQADLVALLARVAILP